MKNKDTIEVCDFTATLRPRKYAYLIAEDSPIDWVIDHVIPSISAVWGGGNYFFFPISKNLEKDSKFSIWLDLLRKYDPDKIISTSNFPQNLLELIKNSVLTNSDIFQYNPTAVTPPIIRSPESIPFEILFKTSPITIPIYDIKPTTNKIYDLWLYAIFGRLGNTKFDSLNRFENNNFVLSEIEISENEIKSNFSNLLEYSYKDYFINSPLRLSMNYLGYRGALDILSDFSIPYIIIVGDNILDWCLFQTLYNFYPDCKWIPKSFLNTAQSNELPHIDLYLNKLLTNRCNAKDNVPFVTSCSLQTEEIKSIVTDSTNAAKKYISDTKIPTPNIELDFNSLVTNWLDWGESNNHKDATLFFDKGISLQKAPCIAPKFFKSEPGQAKYFVDLHSRNYKVLAHHMADTEPFDWTGTGYSNIEKSKRTILGQLTYDPIPLATWHGQEIESAIRSPRIKQINLLDDLQSILSKKNKRAERTIGTYNIYSVINLWNDSIEKFYNDYFKNDSSKIFKTYKMGKKAKNDSSLGLSKKAGIELKNNFLFSHPIYEAFNPNLESFNDTVFDEWLENNILIRGEKLICLNCGKIDFYPETLVSKGFVCTRCHQKNNRNIKSMRAAEPKFLYDMNPLLYGLKDFDSDLVLFGLYKIMQLKHSTFDFECEIEIYDQDNKVEKEIDIIGNLDGQLIAGECKINRKLKGDQLQSYVDFCSMFHISKFFCISDKPWSDGTKENIINTFASATQTELFFIDNT